MSAKEQQRMKEGWWHQYLRGPGCGLLLLELGNQFHVIPLEVESQASREGFMFSILETANKEARAFVEMRKLMGVLKIIKRYATAATN